MTDADRFALLAQDAIEDIEDLAQQKLEDLAAMAMREVIIPLCKEYNVMYTPQLYGVEWCDEEGNLYSMEERPQKWDYDEADLSHVAKLTMAEVLHDTSEVLDTIIWDRRTIGDYTEQYIPEGFVDRGAA